MTTHRSLVVGARWPGVRLRHASSYSVGIICRSRVGSLSRCPIGITLLRPRFGFGADRRQECPDRYVNRKARLRVNLAVPN